MSTNEPKADQRENSVMASVHRHWQFCLAEGAVLIILGLAALVTPRTLAVDILFGWLFVISGITGLITTLLVRAAPGFKWSLLSACLGILTGMLLLMSPRAVLSVTLILIVFFVIEGVASIMYALGHKRGCFGQWQGMMISGIIDLTLAAAIIVGLPGSAQWALGLLVGINLISGGVALVAMALHGRTLDSGATA